MALRSKNVSWRSLAMLASALVGGGMTCPSAGDIRVTWLGVNGVATSTSADGRAVVGYLDDYRYFMWTEATGLQLFPADLHHGTITISSDGQVVAGGKRNPDDSVKAFRWTLATGVQTLGGGCGTCEVVAGSLAQNGLVAAGAFTDYAAGGAGAHPAVWDATGSMSFLPSLAAGSGSVTGCSGDGSVMSGLSMDFVGEPYFVRHRPVVWRNGAIQNLGLPRGDDWGAATGVSSDGSTVIGYSTNGAFTGPEGHAFRWTVEEGMQTLPLFGNQQYVVAHGVSGDGKKIVGWANERNRDGVAILWSEATGTVDLKEYLQHAASRPVLDAHAVLYEAMDISADGTTVVGYGDRGLGYEPFVAYISPDRDGDGILDEWETDGVPYVDSQGVLRRYLLDADGDGATDANPLRKDIFVEVDSMTGMLPFSSTFEAVREAFDRAPVPAPAGLAGGLPGVTLHVTRDEVDLPARNYPGEFVEFQQDKAIYFGTASDRANPEWVARRKARAKVFRYCIFAQELSSSEVLGIGELPGDDFIVAMNGFRSEDPPPSVRLDQITEASTFMHELGHTLGLHHGGDDDVNYKPNYFSVMNYTWNMPYWMNEDEFIRYFPDYSRRLSRSLFEDALQENCAVEPQLSAVTFPRSLDLGHTQCELGSTCDAHGTSNCVRVHWMTGATDWNSDCQIDQTITTYSANINNLGSDDEPDLTRLGGWNDWKQLQYGFLGTPGAVDGAVYVPATPEPTLEEYRILRENRPGSGCVEVSTPATVPVSPARTVTIVAQINTTQAVAMKWQALTASGRLITDLADGPFVDDHTGASYIVSGASSPQLTLTSVAFGSQAGLYVSCVAWNDCGGKHSPPVALNWCSADVNGDGVLDFFDYLDFVAMFAASEPESDFNADTVVDLFDYLDFVAAFAAGC